ncbi:DUF6069 family protein [Streptomyces sp. NPDC004976]
MSACRWTRPVRGPRRPRRSRWAASPGGVLFWSIAGIVLAVALARWAKRPARSFAVTTAALTALSLVGPAVAPHTTTSTQVVRAVSHMAAAVIIPPAGAPALAEAPVTQSEPSPHRSPTPLPKPPHAHAHRSTAIGSTSSPLKGHGFSARLQAEAFWRERRTSRTSDATALVRISAPNPTQRTDAPARYSPTARRRSIVPARTPKAEINVLMRLATCTSSTTTAHGRSDP